jgi:hypothetical protein
MFTCVRDDPGTQGCAEICEVSEMGTKTSEMLKAIAAKGRERATDVLLVGSAFVGCIGFLAAAHA